MTTHIQTILSYENTMMEIQRRPLLSMDEETYAVTIGCEPPGGSCQKLTFVLRRTQLADLWCTIGREINRPETDQLEPTIKSKPHDTGRSNT